MPVIRITDVYSVSGNECQNTYHYFHNARIPTVSDVEGILEEFRDEILPAIAGIQTDQVNHSKLLGYAYNLGFGQELAVDVDGQVTAGGDLTVASNIPLIVRRNLGSTLDNITGADYTGNRPLRRSRFYLSGVPETLMRADGYDEAAALSSALNAFRTALDVDNFLTVDGRNWYHNAFGFALDALPPSPSFPDGKPARGQVVAPVTSLSFVGYTKLKTRKL